MTEKKERAGGVTLEREARRERTGGQAGRELIQERDGGGSAVSEVKCD